MELLEVFDRVRMEHLVKYENFYGPILAETYDCPEDVTAAFTRYRKYLACGIGEFKNTVIVNYRRAAGGRGRLFAAGGLSLQNFDGRVRAFIASDLYYDVDIVNCHPCILSHMCRAHGVSDIFISAYISNREIILRDLIAQNPSMDRPGAKQLILSLIYGKALPDVICTDWLVGFCNELKIVHGLVSEWFPVEFEKKQADASYNPLGKTLAAEICVIEDQIIRQIYEYLKGAKVVDKTAVMVFDGIMIPASLISREKLIVHMAELESILSKQGYEIRLKIKDFEQVLPFDVPDEFVDEQIRLKRERIKSEKSSGALAYKELDYFWYDFMRDMNGKVFDSYSALCEMFRANINKVCMRVYCMDDHLIRKISRDNMFQFDKAIPTEVFKYKEMNARGKITVRKVTLRKLLGDGMISDIQVFNKLDFVPGDEKFDPDARTYNTWTGWQASLIDKSLLDMSKIQIILDHIRDVWCAGNDAHYRYMLSWFKVIFTHPTRKSKVAVVLKSSDKQIGKGILINDFLVPLVFGPSISMSVAGISSITDRFNQDMMNKLLINCDELSNLSGDFHQSFDVLKKRITDRTIKIEIKHGKKFIYPDYSNYIMCTNNDFTIKIEEGDCRYFVLECAPVHKGNHAYFDRLAASFTQGAGDAFFTYVSEIFDSGAQDVRDVPNTPLKRSMMISCLHPSRRFLLDVKSEIEQPLDMIKPAEFYEEFLRWCDLSHEKKCSAQKFYKELASVGIEKKRIGRTNYYDLAGFEYNV